MASAGKETSASRDPLQTYRDKRRFNRTPEPSGDVAAASTSGHSFVIQKHAARRLHYDFRLELDGVLLSWAVPRGPSLKPGERRLAARTEDHPLDYADFEGIIPEGEYGGGTVVVWDRGTWEPEGDPHDGMKKGRLTFKLDGEKLHGRWHLVRTKGDGKGEPWLLFKSRDDAASDTIDIVAERPESVLTGRTLEEVGEAKDRVWHSNRPAEDTVAKRAKWLQGKGKGKGNGNGEQASPDDLEKLVSTLDVGVQLTNLDKILYPDQGLTKAALIAYLVVVSDWMLPHLARRPLSLVRCPDGQDKHCFYQKHARDMVPAVVKRIDIAEDEDTGEYMYVDDLAGVVALAQLGCLEIHTWGCRADKVERPDLLVFDLDPDPALPWSATADTARELRRRLETAGLEAFVKTTGGKGLHVVTPVERRIGWDDFKTFARGVADRLVADHPDRYTSSPLKASRKHKIFIDYLRNARGATFIAPYSMRARPGAPVATPIGWDELEAGVDPTSFTVTTVPRRLGALAADPWAGMADLKQSITAAARRKLGASR